VPEREDVMRRRVLAVCFDIKGKEGSLAPASRCRVLVQEISLFQVDRMLVTNIRYSCDLPAAEERHVGDRRSNVASVSAEAAAAAAAKRACCRSAIVGLLMLSVVVHGPQSTVHSPRSTGLDCISRSFCRGVNVTATGN
jgi:hypothetical protein